MGIRELLFGSRSDDAAPAPAPAVQAMAGPGATGGTFTSLDDPALQDLMRGGAETASGAYVNASSALRNMAVLRCVKLISETIGMLPLNILHNDEQRGQANELPLHKLLRRKPNAYQSAYDFKTLMQMRVLTQGQAFARIIRGIGDRPIRLVPLNNVTCDLNDNYEMVYKHTRKDGTVVTYTNTDEKPHDIFHLRGLSLDGINGLSTVKQASEAIGLALQAEKAAARLFKNGMMIGGALSHPGKLSDDAFRRLKTDMDDRYSGSGNAHKWMVLEEGMTADKFEHTSRDSQHLENRNHQIEEVARAFGVPRPLLMMDDTSWGSGIEQLAIYFVQYTLAPHFTMWEQAIGRDLFSETEAERYLSKFNERALMRGTLKDQAEFFAKALGSGGHQPWMSANEVRDLSDMPESDEEHAKKLAKQATKGTTNEPPAKPA